MKSLMSLVQDILYDCGMSDGVCTARDEQTVRSRVEDEGDSFLTITLPTFAKGLEESLERGSISPSSFPSFRCRKGLPVFLSGFLGLIFDCDGSLLPKPSVSAIRSIRQISLMCAKVLLPSEEVRVQKAMDDYVQCEREVAKLEYRGFSDAGRRTRLGQFGAMLFGELLQDFESALFAGSLDMFLPKHGPGATSDKLVGNQKFKQSEWPRRLDTIFPASDFIVASWKFRHRIESINFLEPGEERPVRVVPVPKTVKTPRIIAIEPTCMQYAQQAVSTAIYSKVEAIPYLKSSIGFMDQTPNQRLAREGSLSGDLATLDLSEASDRVSLELVRCVFTRFPHFLEVLEATRSTKADVLGYGVLPLSKFASMGSALCFPVEAMCFLALSLLGIEEGLGIRFRLKHVKAMLGRTVRIFGDDIIVPADSALTVIDSLESFGLKVNRRKSFWNGKFRESCGTDWYDGHDVSVVRLRRPISDLSQNATNLVSLVSFRNQLYMAGYWETCRRLDPILEKYLRYFPIVGPDSPCLGRISVSFEPMAERIHPDYQIPLVKGRMVYAPIPVNSVDEEDALLKCLLSSYEDSEHLQRSGRPLSVYLKTRWLPAV